MDYRNPYILTLVVLVVAALIAALVLEWRAGRLRAAERLVRDQEARIAQDNLRLALENLEREQVRGLMLDTIIGYYRESPDHDMADEAAMLLELWETAGNIPTRLPEEMAALHRSNRSARMANLKRAIEHLEAAGAALTQATIAKKEYEKHAAKPDEEQEEDLQDTVDFRTALMNECRAEVYRLTGVKA